MFPGTDTLDLISQGSRIGGDGRGRTGDGSGDEGVLREVTPGVVWTSVFFALIKDLVHFKKNRSVSFLPPIWAKGSSFVWAIQLHTPFTRVPSHLSPVGPEVSPESLCRTGDDRWVYGSKEDRP